MGSGFVIIGIHFQIELLKPLADLSVLHHPHELTVGGHAPLNLIKLRSGFIEGIFIGIL